MIGAKVKWKCPKCGNEIHKLQIFQITGDITLQHPTRCGCGAKSRFRIIDIEKKNFEIVEKEVTHELSENIDA